MRELVFKDLTSIKSRKKDIFLKEIFEKDGIVTRVERRCFYFIKGVTHVQSGPKLQKWLNSHDEIAAQDKRQFHILKSHNDSLGEDKVICKIAGTFYAVVKKTIYTIAFLHSFKVTVMKGIAHTQF